ncbi:MAG: type II CAAX endopeptidase family protein [Bacteroidota bacterium]
MKQLTTFFSLAYLISWLTWLPLYIQILPDNSFRYLHALGGLGPLIAAVICTFIFDGKPALKKLAVSTFATSRIFLLLLALVSPFLLNAIAATINYFQKGHWDDLSLIGLSKEFPDFNFIEFFIYNLVFFGFGEEVGWRGFALPRLQKPFKALNASLILSLFWAIWHWPLFLYRPGYMSMDILGALGWIFSLLTGSILLTWLFNTSRGSILVCAVFHSAMDVAFTSDYLDKNIVGLVGMLVTLWGIVTLLIFKPLNLSSSEKVTSVDAG